MSTASCPVHFLDLILLVSPPAELRLLPQLLLQALLRLKTQSRLPLHLQLQLVTRMQTQPLLANQSDSARTAAILGTWMTCLWQPSLLTASQL